MGANTLGDWACIIAGTALFEAPPAEQNAMGQLANAGRAPELRDFFLHAAAIPAMNHAEQIVWPVWRPARAPVAKGDRRILGKSFSDGTYRFVGNIPDHHGIGTVAKLVVAHDDAESLDDTARL